MDEKNIPMMSPYYDHILCYKIRSRKYEIQSQNYDFKRLNYEVKSHTQVSQERS